MNKMTEQNWNVTQLRVRAMAFLLHGNLISRARERSERRLRNQRTSDTITFLKYLQQYVCSTCAWLVEYLNKLAHRLPEVHAT